MTRLSSLIAKSLVTLLTAGGALATNLQAQSESVTVKVPFSFTVGTQSIAPGTYQFSLLSNQFQLSVLNLKTGDMEMFTVRPERQRAFEQQGRLVFGNAEGSSALNEVHFPGTRMFSEVIERHGAERLDAKRSSAGNSISMAQR